MLRWEMEKRSLGETVKRSLGETGKRRTTTSPACEELGTTTIITLLTFYTIITFYGIQHLKLDPAST
jgi:hypothetical protein